MGSRLSAARADRAWSQARLVSELERRGRSTGFAVMARSSLKTALSRWENGHFVPDRHYRRLFRQIYGLTDAELGFATEPAAVNADLAEVDLELRGRIAAAARVDGAMVGILQAQTDNIRRLDRRLGAPVLLDQMTVHLSTLRQLLSHAVLDGTRQPIAAVPADAAALAGWQALDVGAISRAWQCYEVATDAGEISGHPELLAHARGEQAYALLDLGQTADAVQLVREARQDAGTTVPPRMISWLWAAEAELAASAGLDSALPARARPRRRCTADRADERPRNAIRLSGRAPLDPVAWQCPGPSGRS
jgi:transcriptional regulator with XRE-family HTH domain